MSFLKALIGDRLRENGRFVIAIDGRCAAGKTTLAQSLGEEFGGSVIHMDDFFLREEQRTPTRLAEIGGNVDRERFAEEVLKPLMRKEEFSYRPYSCRDGRLGDPVPIPRDGLVLVEGSYSLHPEFGRYYDLSLFLDVSPEEQMKRLERRSPEKLERFRTEWIPKEEAYFRAFSVGEKCDMLLNFQKQNL